MFLIGYRPERQTLIGIFNKKAKTTMKPEDLEEREVDLPLGLAIKQSLVYVLCFFISLVVGGVVFWLVFSLPVWLGAVNSLVWGFVGFLAGSILGSYVSYKLLMRLVARLGRLSAPSKFGERPPNLATKADRNNLE